MFCDDSSNMFLGTLPSFFGSICSPTNGGPLRIFQAVLSFLRLRFTPTQPTEPASFDLFCSLAYLRASLRQFPIGSSLRIVIYFVHRTSCFGQGLVRGILVRIVFCSGVRTQLFCP